MASVAASFFSGWGAPSKAEGEWSNLLAEAQHLLRDIAIDFQDRDARSRRGADGARLTAGLRRKLNTMTERLDRLELELLPALQLAPAEAAKRREVLFRMRKEMELLNARLSGAQTGLDRASLFGAPTMGGSSTGSRGALAPAAHVAGRAYEETERTQGLDNGSVLLQQRSVMQQQDSRLVDICATVSNLKRTSLAINEELREQASMVDSLATDVDKTHSRLRRAEQRSAAMVGAKSETTPVDSSQLGETTTWTQDNCSLM